MCVGDSASAHVGGVGVGMCLRVRVCVFVCVFEREAQIVSVFACV